MVLKNVFVASFCTTLLALGSASLAAEYRPGDFLNLDLSKAVLSPKSLGPATEFAPFPIEADTDPGNTTPAKTAAQARAEPKSASEAAAPAIRIAKTRTEHTRGEKPRGAAPVKLARRHSNPLDAEAFDRRIQVWPCKTGGICDWQRR